MKTFITCLLVVFTAQFSSAQVTQIEFSDVKFNNIGYHNFFKADDRHVYLLGSKSVLEISDSIKEHKLSSSIGYLITNESNTKLGQVFDSTSFKLYRLDRSYPSSFKTEITLSCIDLKNTLASKKYEFKTADKKLDSSNFHLFVNNGVLNLYVATNDYLSVYELNNELQDFKLLSSEKLINKKVIFQTDPFNNFYRMDIVKLENKGAYELALFNFNESENQFLSYGFLPIEIDDEIIDKITNQLIFTPILSVNPLNKNSCVLSFSFLTEKANDNSAVANRYRKHHIYECNFKEESYNKHVINQQKLASITQPGLDIIFQKDDIKYLEKGTIELDYNPYSVSGKNNQSHYYRMEYLLGENNQFESKLHEYHVDILPWLDDRIDHEDNSILNEPQKYSKILFDLLEHSSVYTGENEITSYLFAIGNQKNGYFGYYFVFKTQLEN